jgi:hypothetical protein
MKKKKTPFAALHAEAIKRAADTETKDSVRCSALVADVEAELSKAEKRQRDAWLEQRLFDHEQASEDIHALERVAEIMRRRSATGELCRRSEPPVT